MRTISLVLVPICLLALAATASAQPTCAGMSMSDQDVKTIVDRERSARSDLPGPFATYSWVVRRQECHYLYIEYAVPAGAERNRTFTVNQRGVIVDVQPGSMTCPDASINTEDLAQALRAERLKRSDLPAPIPLATTRVFKRGCEYVYEESGQVDSKRTFQWFSFDAFGELMGFVRPLSF